MKCGNASLAILPQDCLQPVLRKPCLQLEGAVGFSAASSAPAISAESFCNMRGELVLETNFECKTVFIRN